jgi:xylan 1,4-beta-xylosidase
MQTIDNPILSGFHPDPSILRVNDDYYIATSTFEWFPGVEISHSRDLIHWKTIARPLNRISQLNMAGNPNSGGIWAPCLSYDNETFYLIYTDVKAHQSIFKDAHNYLVTTKDITGDWSEPVYLNSKGFDASLYHDNDGRKWLLSMIWDHRVGKNPFAGIILQEYSESQKKLIGTVRNIFKGTSLGVVEGPHIYKRNGFYYLMTAEGGTGLTHAVTMARSKDLARPYEVDPTNPILTSRYDSQLYLQRAGHASLVETQTGEWYLAHLCGRPIPSNGRCVLGRETAIQKMVWTGDGWLRMESGVNKPDRKVPAPALKEHPWEKRADRDNFESDKLDIQFQTLRVPFDENNMTLCERKGFLRLKGGESLSSFHRQSLVARRQEHFSYTAQTCVEFEPESFQQMAGLICMYDSTNFYYLHISHDEDRGKSLSILCCRNGSFSNGLADPIPISDAARCHLRAEVDYHQLKFSYSVDEKNWIDAGPVFDASTLSDEFGPGGADGHFTGAFVGICCQDISGGKHPADFDYFEYIKR